VLTLGDVTRFQRGKQVASYLGLIPKASAVIGPTPGWVINSWACGFPTAAFSTA
jgi:hypothetical protein